MYDLLTILQSKGVLSETDVASVAEEADRTGRTLETLLMERGVSPEHVLEAKGEHWGIPTRTVPKEAIPYDALKYIPEESAKHYHVIPLALVDGALEVGVVDPDNIEALDALNFISTKEGVPFKVVLVSEADYEHALGNYRGFASEVGSALTMIGSEDTSDESSLSSGTGEAQSLDDLEATVQQAGKKGGGADIHEEAPITKIVATILRSAIESRASDIHVEPEYSRVRVRFRVDGRLNQSLILPSKVHRSVAARIKILAGIKLDERRKPQDGRFSATISGRRVDFRVSTFPTYYGEKAVLRILDSERSKITLEELGMDQNQLAIVRRAVKAPYGMILITGPTGSGKSTTLYAMLNEVDRETLNVLSLEDPVEYSIQGVSQSQMRPEIGYTFAAGIRSVLRQDPDIIMVGEIRDKETAQLAVQAALTGHLVLSTLHTNNAIGAVPRLVDMGVDPFLLAPTLELVIAQRLVRKLCPDTGTPVPIEGALRRMVDDQFSTLPKEFRSRITIAKEFTAIKPSSTCPTGTRGRLGVYEMFDANEDIKRAILSRADEATVADIARKNGMLTLKEDAIIKAMAKLIPFEEIAAVGGALDLESVSKEEQLPDTLEGVDLSEDSTKGSVAEEGHELI